MEQHRITQLKEISALLRVGKKLHTSKTVEIFSCGGKRELTIDDFTDIVLTTKEAKAVLEIVKQDGLLFYPTEEAYGCGQSRIYTIARLQDIDGIQEVQEIMKFRQRQMPEEYNYERLSKDFVYADSGPHNRRPAVVSGGK